MASCNMCRNGKTALGRDCRNGCKPANTWDIMERLQKLSEIVEAEETCRDAIGALTRLRDMESDACPHCGINKVRAERATDF